MHEALDNAGVVLNDEDVRRIIHACPPTTKIQSS